MHSISHNVSSNISSRSAVLWSETWLLCFKTIELCRYTERRETKQAWQRVDSLYRGLCLSWILHLLQLSPSIWGILFAFPANLVRPIDPQPIIFPYSCFIIFVEEDEPNPSFPMLIVVVISFLFLPPSLFTRVPFRHWHSSWRPAGPPSRDYSFSRGPQS